MIFRQFYLKKDAIFFYKICNIARDYLDEEERNVWDIFRSEFKMIEQAGGGIKIQINEDILTPQHIMDLFFNGEYFHTDIEIAKQLETYRQIPVGGQFLLFHFQSLVIHLSARVIGISNLIAARILSEPKVAFAGLPGIVKDEILIP